ncbi:Unknown protein sequence, partial [Pseudomonas syringae pv. syringae]
GKACGPFADKSAPTPVGQNQDGLLDKGSRTGNVTQSAHHYAQVRF